MNKHGYVYILANKRNGTLYIGVTSDIHSWIFQHKNDLIEGFSKRYQTHILVYVETLSFITDAIMREKSLKWITRNRKIELIESINPHWNDLSEKL